MSKSHLEEAPRYMDRHGKLCIDTAQISLRGDLIAVANSSHFQAMVTAGRGVYNAGNLCYFNLYGPDVEVVRENILVVDQFPVRMEPKVYQATVANGDIAEESWVEEELTLDLYALLHKKGSFRPVYRIVDSSLIERIRSAFTDSVKRKESFLPF